MSSSDIWTANGVDLQPSSGWCWIEDYTPMMAPPGIRGANIPVPRSHGEVRTRGKRYTAADITVPVWVFGVDPLTGFDPADPALQLRINIDRLQRVFAAETIRLVHSYAGVGARVGVVEPAPEAPTITRHNGEVPAARIDFPVRLFGGFWAEEDARVQEFEGPTGTVVELDQFAGASAPMTDLQIVLVGAVSNPLLIHGRRTQQWNGVIDAGRQLLVSTGSWSVTPGTGTAWSPDFRQLSWTGPGLLELDPSLDPFAVGFHHTGGGRARGWITARRKYLNP